MDWLYLSCGLLALLAWALCRAGGEARQEGDQAFEAYRKEVKTHGVQGENSQD